ncbi:MAG: hypothetical protein HW421_1736 [Ignavibacteria bacterium]|nr:hypothetical protein [Ignavibacteria bacterium]
MKSKSSSFQNPIIIILGIALLKLILHFYFNAYAGYGIFRDEYYYISCSNHLDWGYVDQPPLSILILKFVILIFGKSQFAIRLVPSIIGAITVIITGLIIKKLDGNRFSIVYGCVTIALAPIYLGFTGFYSMNIIDMLLWLISAYLIVKIIKEDNTKLFVLLGFIFGLGVMNKISMVWMIIGFCVALFFKPYRMWFRSKYLYIALSICFIMAVPFIIWNFQHDFAHLEFMRNASKLKYSSTNPMSLVFDQLMLMTPVFVFNIIALILYLKTETEKKYKILPIIFFTIFVLTSALGHPKH